MLSRLMILAMWMLPVASTIGAPLEVPGLYEALDTLLDTHATARRTTVSLKVVDLQSGDVLYNRGGDRLMTPASNLKIYTSACALDRFGPGYRFTTRVTATGPIRNNTLDGVLVLVGGGDTMLGNRDLGRLADRVAEHWGVKRILGRVLVDNSRYSPRRKGPGWMWDDDPDYYNMPVSPLMVDFNVLTVHVFDQPDGAVTAELLPPSYYPPLRIIDNKIDGVGYQITRRPFEHEIQIVGQGPAGELLERRMTPHDPTAWVEAMFTEMLRARGVEVQQQMKQTKQLSPDPTVQPLTYESVSLAATLRHFNHVSENAVGEVLLHEIAIAQGTKRPTWSHGAQAITNWLVDTAGLENDSFRLVDGSGLSRYNLISADSSVELLVFMRRHRHHHAFFDALPAYEVEIDGGAKRELVRAKSGGMSGVSTISGYLETLEGRQLAFSLLANGYVGLNKPVLDLREKVWRTLVHYQP